MSGARARGHTLQSLELRVEFEGGKEDVQHLRRRREAHGGLLRPLLLHAQNKIRKGTLRQVRHCGLGEGEDAADEGALDAHCLLELGEGHRRLEPRRHVLERPRGEVVVVDIEDRSDEVGVSSEQIVEGVGKLLVGGRAPVAHDGIVGLLAQPHQRLVRNLPQLLVLRLAQQGRRQSTVRDDEVLKIKQGAAARDPCT